MKLTRAQIDQYERDGFLIFPELFSREEIDILRREAARVAEVESEMVVREGKARAPKSMFRLHEKDGPTASPAYQALCRLPRTLGVAQQLLGDEDLYLHHCKVNVKTAIEGSVWPWHQDYGSWQRDGIDRPDMATFMVAFDEASEINGCLYFLPGSHKIGRTDPYFDTSTAYKLWAVQPEDMKRMLRASPPPVPVVGKPGMAAIFHCNLMHSSGHNLAAEDRWQAYLCYNTVANHPHDVENPRPDWVRSRNWASLRPVHDTALRDSLLATA